MKLLLVISLSIIFILGLGFSLLNSSFSLFECENTQTIVKSKFDNKKLLIITKDCGATTNQSNQVKLVDGKNENLLLITDGGQVTAYFSSKNSVVIHIICGKVFNKSNANFDVNIKYIIDGC